MTARCISIIHCKYNSFKTNECKYKYIFLQKLIRNETEHSTLRERCNQK